MYASRFLGDRAYLVTFRQTDPLYVIDLADSAQPTLAGELQINCFTSPNASTGRVLGMKLSLFDVSTAASPVEVQSVLIGQRGTESRALFDHRAITVQRATEQHPTRVSFGIDVYGQALPSSSATGDNVFQNYNWNYSGLHGFDISTGADAGITSRGALVVESPDSNDVYYYPSYADDRSVMVNDSLFYIRGDRVYAAPWDDLANPTPAR